MPAAQLSLDLGDSLPSSCASWVALRGISQSASSGPAPAALSRGRVVGIGGVASADASPTVQPHPLRAVDRAASSA